MSISSIMKLVGLSGSLGNETAKASNSSKSPILGIAAGVLGTAFPAAGMVMGILNSIGLDSIEKTNPEAAEEIKKYMEEYNSNMEALANEASQIERFTRHMSAEEVDESGKGQGYW